MEALTLDNSVVMSWFFRDERTPYAKSVLGAIPDRRVHVPSVWLLEAGNTILVSERRGRIHATEVPELLAMVQDLPFIVEQEPNGRVLREIFALAREHQLSTYGASYLDLAMRKGLSLATQDNSLRRAAGKCGVPLFKP